MQPDEVPEGRFGQEGRIPIEDHIRRGAAAPRTGKDRTRLHHGMTGPELLRLFGDENGGRLRGSVRDVSRQPLLALRRPTTTSQTLIHRVIAFNGRFDLLPLVPHDHHNALTRQAFRQLDGVQHHGAPGDLMEDLCQLGPHPFARAGRHHDRTETPDSATLRRTKPGPHAIGTSRSGRESFPPADLGPVAGCIG